MEGSFIGIYLIYQPPQHHATKLRDTTIQLAMHGWITHAIVEKQVITSKGGINMLKQVIAQLKQSPELLSQLQQGRLSFAGVSPEEHRALAEVMKAQSGEPRKNAKFWM